MSGLSILYFLLIFTGSPLKTEPISIYNKVILKKTNNGSTPWKSTKTETIRRKLTSDNNKDILSGLKLVYSVQWKKIRQYVLPHIYNIDDSISNRVLDLAVLHHDPIASPLLRQAIVFSYTINDKIKSISKLASLGNEKDHSFFIRLLRYQNLKIRIKVIKIIGDLKLKKATNKLVSLLRDSREPVRIAVIEALEKIGSNEAVIPLISKLSDPSDNVKSRVIKALSKFKSPRAKIALMRILRTGTKSERLAIMENISGAFPRNSYLKDILRQGSLKERLKAISLLKGKIDNEMILLLSTLITYYKYYSPILNRAGTKIIPKDINLIKLLLNSKKLNYSQKFFLVKLLAGSKLPGSIQFLVSLYEKGIIPQSTLLTGLKVSSNAVATLAKIKFFQKTFSSNKIIIIKHFISIKDDRLVPVYLQALKKNGNLLKFLLPYALSTKSALFVKPLLSRLKDPLYKNKNLIIKALAQIGSPSSIPNIIASGSYLKKAQLYGWSNFLLNNLNTRNLRLLSKIPATSDDLKRELFFLFTAAKYRGIKFPSHFNLPRSDSYKNGKLWYSAALIKDNVIPKEIPKQLLPLFIDLLDRNLKLPDYILEKAKTDNHLLRSISRFNINPYLKLKALSSSDSCTRINAVRSTINELKSNSSGALKMALNENNSFVIFNILFFSPASKQSISIARNLFVQKNGISNYQWGLLLGKWPKKISKILSKEWKIKIIKKPSGKPVHIARFHVYQLPQYLKCIVTSLPSGSFRSFGVPDGGDLLIPGIHNGKLSIYPVFSKH